MVKNMSIDNKLLLYNIIETFKSLDVPICKSSVKYLEQEKIYCNEISLDEKIYYKKYSLLIIQKLLDYLGGIMKFEINMDEDRDYDFRLKKEDNDMINISMYHNSIKIKDIIPKKLMKICKYSKNTKITKEYNEKYDEIVKEAYDKICSKNKYSDISEKTKISLLYSPICNLVYDKLSRKRNCSENLYKHIFQECGRMVLKLYKNRFTIYDFNLQSDMEIKSFRMKMVLPNKLLLTFNNGANFNLILQTNGSEIKQYISLKFHVSFINMNNLFAISTSTI